MSEQLSCMDAIVGLDPERCWHCDDLTGRAGRADDSLYDALDHGPYCPDCWNTLCESVEDDYARLQAIINKLPTDANGNPVLPGSDIWFVFERDRSIRKIAVPSMSLGLAHYCEYGFEQVLTTGNCHTTHAAAEAARQQTTGPQQTRKVQ